MAEGEERKLVADAERKSKIPTGFRFKPTDEELVEFYLLPKLQGRPTVPVDAIIEANVYEFHPETLFYDKYRGRGEDALYFLSPRTRMYKKGVRPARKTQDGCGRWKSSSSATKKMVNKTVGDGIRFCKNVLNYFVGTPKEEDRTDWIMRELTIPAYEIKHGSSSATLDRYVMCKIYLSSVHKAVDDEAGTSSAFEEEEAQHSQLTSVSVLSRCATARKQACQGGSLTIGETTASSAGHVPVPAQPTIYNNHAPVPRPPIPTQFPPTAYPNSYGLMTTMVRPANLDFPVPGTGSRPRRCPAIATTTQLQGHATTPGNVAYGIPPQQRPMAFAPPPSWQQQQHPFFNGNANDHAGAIASRWPTYNSNLYEGSSMAHAAGDHGEATPSYTGTGMRGGNVDAGQYHFVELASINTLLAESRPQTAAVPRIELATSIHPPQVETGIEGASRLHKQDTA